MNTTSYVSNISVGWATFGRFLSHGTLLVSYGVSLAIWDHTVLPATRHKWTHPASSPAMQAGTRFTYPWGAGLSQPGLPEAREAAQDRVYWRMFTKHSATHS